MVERVRTHSRILALLAVPALALAGCSSGPEQPKTVAQQFADALNRDDAAAAAALTDNPGEAAAVIGQLYDGLGKEVTYQVRDAGKDGFTLAATWKLGSEGKKEWSYTTTGTAADRNGWKIAWKPAMLAPGLEVGPLSYGPAYPAPARILDASGGELMSQQVITLVNLAPGGDAAALAALLAPVAPGITAASLQAELAAAQGKPITAISLRPADLAPIEERLTKVTGVTLAPQTRLVVTDRALASPTLSGLVELWQKTTDEASGWAVRAKAADGNTVRVAGQDPKPTADITTTLDPGLQRAAEAALAPIQQPAAIVALQPSTGKVLAMAENAAGDAQGPIALTGLYPPGSTFKTVTVSAALQAGIATPDTVLPCPGSENIEGRRIPNDNNFDLGRVPLHTAFANSCNTTMGRLAVQLPPDALTKAAAQLGLGIDYVTPGLTTVTGKVPAADTPAKRVEAGIGQGQVTATPFGMALVAASLANGAVPAPMLVAGQPGVADRTPAPLPPGIADQIKTMMRETITGGTATALRDIPGLLGKTGTAEYGDNTHAHGWFVGISDDLAFAVFVSDAGSSAPAVEAAGRMLRAPR